MALNSCDIDIRPRLKIGTSYLHVQYEAQETYTKLWIHSNSKATVIDDNGVEHGVLDDPAAELELTVTWQGAANQSVTITSKMPGSSTVISPDVATRGTYRADEPASSPCYQLEGPEVWNVLRLQNKGCSTSLDFKK